MLSISDLTIVTTIDFNYRRLNLIRNAHRFFVMCEKIGLPVSVAIATRGVVDKITSYLFKKIYKNVTVVNVDHKENNNICNGKLRNNAVKVCNSKYIILSDIDLVFWSETVEYILHKLKDNKYVMLPCVYLSKQGSNMFKRLYFHNLNNVINNKKNVNHCAIPSSFICLKRADYIKVNGFDERYIGHGYEDFDFLLRYFAYINKINLKTMDFGDETYTSPLFVRGMRAEPAMCCIDEILANVFVVHLWHEKNVGYKKTRFSNSEIIRKKFLNINENSKMNDKLNAGKYPVLAYLIDYCEMNNKKIEEFRLVAI